MIYIRVFVKIYTQYNKKLFYEIHRIIKVKKYPISKIKIILNLGADLFYKIFEFLQSVNKSKVIFINNYINQG